MNNGFNFTERVRKVLSLARDESHELQHEYVGTEHILLGLLKEGEGVASAVLQIVGADISSIRDEVLQHVAKGRSIQPTRPDLPYTSRAKKVLELSMDEARKLQHSYVGTEHLLMGLLLEEKGVAAQVLLNNGITLSRVRVETLRLLGNPDVTPRVSHNVWDTAEGKFRQASAVRAVFVEMHFEDGTTLRKEFANAAWAIKYLESL